MNAPGDVAPQQARFHDIGLVDLAQAMLALLRQLETGADDALDLGLGINLGVDAAAAAVGQGLDAARLAEIDAAGQLTHDHQVEPGDELTLQARRIGQRLEHQRRAQIGEQIHFLAQPQEAALGLQFEWQGFPFRPADRAEQHRIAGLRLGQGFVGQRRAGSLIGGAADQPLADLEAGEVAAVEKLDDAHDLAHDLRADAVAGQDENFAVGAGLSHVSVPEISTDMPHP